MHNRNVLEREAIINVDRGLYVLKYGSGATSGPSPTAVASPVEGSERYIQIISAPGAVVGLLSFPGECAVVRAEQAGGLSIKVRRQTGGGSLDATFRLEPISGVDRSPERVSLRGSVGTGAPLPQPSTAFAPSFRLLAHVARRGDVEVAAGEWAAGPTSPSAIEGLEIRGSFPQGTRIEIQPLLGANPPRWLDWTPAGVFAGTRGRALPLAGLRVRLVGVDSGRFILSSEALFLGSAIISKRGREIEMVGPGNGDPLVGLRLDIEYDAGSNAGTHAPAETGANALQHSEPRVSVFRAAARA